MRIKVESYIPEYWNIAFFRIRIHFYSKSKLNLLEKGDLKNDRQTVPTETR